MAITPLPPPPSSADPANFNARADAFLGALPQFASEANAQAAEVQGNAAAAASSASASAASASSAAAQASSAAGSANTAALTANFKGAWSSLSGALSKPAAVLHQGSYWMLLNDLSNVAASQPGVSADWAVFSPVMPVKEISADTVASPFVDYYMTAPCKLTLPSCVTGYVVGLSLAPGVEGATALIDSGTAALHGLTGVSSISIVGFRYVFKANNGKWV